VKLHDKNYITSGADTSDPHLRNEGDKVKEALGGCGETLLQVTSHGMEMIPRTNLLYELSCYWHLAIIKQEIAHAVSRSTIRN
jgi:hypothetical protein